MTKKLWNHRWTQIDTDGFYLCLSVCICGLKSPNLLGGEVPLTHKS